MGTLSESNIWEDIPDTLLLEIFQYLDFQPLLRCSAVCKIWQRVALDESLWKKLVRCKWNIKNRELSPGKELWYNEFKRFYYHTPVIESEVLTQHTDEVLDATFSHNGKYICTTSKDCTVKVWELGFPTTLKYEADMEDMFNWSLTQYAAFNKTDKYLLVCGVNINGIYYSEFFMGHGVVFDMTQDFCVVRVMGMNPPHLFADWADTDICLGGYATNHNFLTINSFKIPDQKQRKITDKPTAPDPQEIVENTDGNKLCTFYADCNHTMNLMVANVPTRPKELQNCDEEINKNSNAVIENYEEINKNSNSVIENDEESNKNSNAVIENDEEINKNSNAMIENSEGDAKFTKYLVFVAGIHDSIIIHKLNNVRTSRDFDEGNVVRPSNYEIIRRPGQYISGMKLSHDHRYLYFNFRETEPAQEGDEEDYLRLKENLEVNMIDLQTRKVVQGVSYKGHKGFSEYPAWYICLDTSDDIVASGSEEAKVYLWDKHYQCLISTLQHEEGVVNGLEFNPRDYECVVTSGDDHTIRIWRSRNRMNSLRKQSYN